MDDYAIVKKIGRGKYSHVFEGINQRTKKQVAVKVLVPIKPEKIKREYYILKKLHHPNIIKIVDIVKAPNLRTTSMVFENMPYVEYRDLYPKMAYNDMKNYMKQLFSVND